MDFKDYYRILGVDKNATKDEIRKAFRKLARKYHPDVAENKFLADYKFKELNEAYEVLSDPEKRKKYDSIGRNWNQSTAKPNTSKQYKAPPQNQWEQAKTKNKAKNFKFEGTGFSDFFEQFFGGSNESFFGFGKNKSNDSVNPDVKGDILVSLAESINGSIREITLRHTNPETGKVEIEKFKVRIPKGVRDGQRLKISGKGAKQSDGKAGTLYLNVKLQKHPSYHVEGDHLYYDLELTPWEAALGDRIIVPLLDGKIAVKVPPGTQAGTQLRAKAKGLPDKNDKRGDLYLLIEIVIPEENQISTEEQKLWEMIAARSNFNPRND